ncbi:MAG: ATP synthase F0 subunit C [Patescibacteria group bacterium]
MEQEVTKEVATGILSNLEAVKSIASMLAIAAGAFGPAFAIGKLAAKAMEAIGRNPEAANKIQIPMIMAIAFLEAIAIYTLVVSLVIKFV